MSRYGVTEYQMEGKWRLLTYLASAIYLLRRRAESGILLAARLTLDYLILHLDPIRVMHKVTEYLVA